MLMLLSATEQGLASALMRTSTTKFLSVLAILTAEGCHTSSHYQDCTWTSIARRTHAADNKRNQA